MGGLRAGMALTVVALVATALVPTTAAGEDVEQHFQPTADAHVDSSQPSTSYGGDRAMWVDGSPPKELFMRFDVSGVGTGTVTSAVLRLYQRDDADTGGEVLGVSSTTWTESITWESRPPIDGASTGSFGPVANGNWYEIDVGPLVTGDGPVALAVRSASADGARWQSRESSTPPQLVLTVAPPTTSTTSTTSTPPPPVEDPAVTTVATNDEGSSTPTIGTPQHRVARTAGGRVLALYGRHASGIQLAWRDPGGAWQTATRGDTTTGGLLTGTGTGDWPASVAVARDSSGVEHAWVAWAGRRPTNPSALVVTRLSELDAPGGPLVARNVVLDSTPGFKADLAVEEGPTGSRMAVTWTRPAAAGGFEVLAGWITDPDTDTPVLTATAVLLANPSDSRFGTLVSTPNGIRAVLRGKSGRLQVWRHDMVEPLTTWHVGPASTLVADQPTAVLLSDGTVLAATESDTNVGVVSVQRFSATGEPQPVELHLAGYRQPTLAGSGDRVWLVMVRDADGLVVSRELTGGAWATSDRIEIGPEGGGNHAWPNAVRSADGRLTFVVRGPVGSDSIRSAVLAVDRRA